MRHVFLLLSLTGLFACGAPAEPPIPSQPAVEAGLGTKADNPNAPTDPVSKLAATTFTLSADILETADLPFEQQSTYVSMEIPYAPVAAVRSQLDTALGTNLKNRGEAHITVLTPQEFGTLKTKIRSDELSRLARDFPIQASDLRVICLGVGQSRTRPQDQTYYLVVESERLVEYRTEIQDLYRARGGTKPFDAAHFYPHITVGFTKRDLHEADGVIKDIATCPHADNIVIPGVTDVDAGPDADPTSPPDAGPDTFDP